MAGANQPDAQECCPKNENGYRTAGLQRELRFSATLDDSDYVSLWFVLT